MPISKRPGEPPKPDKPYIRPPAPTPTPTPRPAGKRRKPPTMDEIKRMMLERRRKMQREKRNGAPQTPAPAPTPAVAPSAKPGIPPQPAPPPLPPKPKPRPKPKLPTGLKKQKPTKPRPK